jgi:hypothetical protein
MGTVSSGGCGAVVHPKMKPAIMTTLVRNMGSPLQSMAVVGEASSHDSAVAARADMAKSAHRGEDAAPTQKGLISTPPSGYRNSAARFFKEGRTDSVAQAG